MRWFGRKREVTSDPLSVGRVADKASFLAFLSALNADLRDHPEAWENPELTRFPEAMERWTHDWKKFEKSPNPWRHAASLLIAARIYE
ncbi:MAG TPA: hypothetical protein VMD53_02830 [Rhizomicrobium sp.]|nr:hypothetical protein [Rhizomicrobium sp.]